jgi:hypothetical protein
MPEGNPYMQELGQLQNAIVDMFDDPGEIRLTLDRLVELESQLAQKAVRNRDRPTCTHGTSADSSASNCEDCQEERRREVLGRVHLAFVGHSRQEHEVVAADGDDMGSLWHRPLREVAAATDELTDRVWYARKPVDAQGGVWRGEKPMLNQAIMASMLSRMRNLEQRYGRETLIPRDDFGWGVTCGRLAALRWVLGSDWDDMDT